MVQGRRNARFQARIFPDHIIFDILGLNTVSRFNSTVLKFHDFPKSTNRDGFNFALRENL
jgi:hypothetical protein